MNDSTRTLLEDPSIFHYKQYWLDAQPDSIDELVLAIFSFGTIDDLVSLEVSLSSLMVEKMKKLTLVWIAMEQRNTSYVSVMKRCQISDSNLLETYLISLNSFIDCRFDQVGQALTVLNCLDGRDIYCNEKPLPYLIQAPMTKTILIERLQSWKMKLQKQILE